MIQRMRFGVAVLWVVVVMSAGAVAQVTSGTIVGAIRDANGVVPGAAVTIHEVNKGTSDTYVTDENGSYTAPFLTPGTYTVEVNVQGFRRWRREGVVLQVNQRARVDVALEVGGIEETTAAAAFSTGPVTSTSIPHCRSASPCSAARTSSSAGMRSTCSIILVSASRTRTSIRRRRAGSRRPRLTIDRCSSR